MSIDTQPPTVPTNSLSVTIVTDTLQAGTINAGDTVTFAWSSRNAGVNDAATVEGDLTAFGLGLVNLHDDGLNGDFFAGDGLFSYTATIPAGSFQRFTPDWKVRVTDEAGNRTGWVTAGATTQMDTKAPSLVSVTTLDRNGNGKVDAVLLVFDEPVRDSSVVANDFSIGGVLGAGIDTGSTVNDDRVTVTLPANAELTGTGPKTFACVAGAATDLAGHALRLYAIGDIAVMDGAAPVMLTAVASDSVNRPIAGADAGDTVTMTFSEPTNAPVINAANIDGVLGLSGGHSWKDASGAIGSAVWDGSKTGQTTSPRSTPASSNELTCTTARPAGRRSSASMRGATRSPEAAATRFASP